MGKHLVLVGGGHAHMTALLNLNTYIDRGHRVTLVSPSQHQYYSGMGPGMLSGTYSPQQVRFHVSRMAQDRGGRFVKDTVTGVDAASRVLTLQSGEEVQYDVVSFNTGSRVPMEGLVPVPQDNVFPVKPITELLRARRLVLDRLTEGERLRALVVGGGPAGVEICANLCRLISAHGGNASVTLIGGARLLPAFPDRARRHALASLSQRDVEVVEGDFAENVDGGKALLAGGRIVPYDVAFVAVGVRPHSLFRDSDLPTGADGGLLVNSRLQSVGHRELFGGGDCISLAGRPLARAGVYAVRQNTILYHNLMAALEEGELRQFDPGGDYLLILNLGNGKGILRRKGWVWHGRLPFLLKDYIDRRFMRRFQVSGELSEELEGIE